jgi:hypothetical protein
MIRCLSIATALAVALVAQPSYAAKKPQNARPQARKAPAMVAHQNAPQARAPIARSAPRQIQRAPSVAATQQRARVQQPRNVQAQRNIAAQSSLRAQRRQSQRIQAQRSPAVQNTQIAQRNQANAIAANRAQAVRNQRNSIAFGGQTRITNNSRVDVRNRSYYRPPVDVYRNWHQGREYTWNDHRYHWRNGGWVIIDAGPDYYYDSPSVVYRSFDNDVSVLASVQSRLDREGYDAGPADGVMGGRTSSAIAAYQQDHGLKVTGEVTDGLLRSLDLK